MSNGGEEVAFVSRNNPHSDLSDVAHDLVELPILVNPTPPVDKLIGGSIGVDRDECDAETDFLHMMEIQRRRRMNGLRYVGGDATMTTITCDGVEQRVVYTWSKEPVNPVVPAPIDWQVRRAAPTGGSWLKRQMAGRKARKRARWPTENKLASMIRQRVEQPC